MHAALTIDMHVERLQLINLPLLLLPCKQDVINCLYKRRLNEYVNSWRRSRTLAFSLNNSKDVRLIAVVRMQQQRQVKVQHLGWQRKQRKEEKEEAEAVVVVVGVWTWWWQAVLKMMLYDPYKCKNNNRSLKGRRWRDLVIVIYFSLSAERIWPTCSSIRICVWTGTGTVTEKDIGTTNPRADWCYCSATTAATRLRLTESNYEKEKEEDIYGTRTSIPMPTPPSSDRYAHGRRHAPLTSAVRNSVPYSVSLAGQGEVNKEQ